MNSHRSRSRFNEDIDFPMDNNVIKKFQTDKLMMKSKSSLNPKLAVIANKKGRKTFQINTNAFEKCFVDCTNKKFIN